jgi:histidine ammonia-lyase
VTVTVNGQSLTIEKLVRISRDAEQVELGSAAVEPGQASGSRFVA